MKVFAIELTNWCNAKCSFCPYPTPAHTRSKGYMDITTLERIADLITVPRRINLSGLGEPTLHPDLVAFVETLTRRGVCTQLNTNGQQLNQELYDRLVGAGLARVVLTSDYFPWKKGKLKVNDSCPITFYTISRDPDLPELGQVRKELDNWAGQVGEKSFIRKRVRCSFLWEDFVQICWDGTVQRCCCDFNANEKLGSIWDNAFLDRYYDGAFRGKEISLCQSCCGYVFKDGIIAGNFTGEDTSEPPPAFVDLRTS